MSSTADVNKKLSSLVKEFEKELNELNDKAKQISKNTLVMQNYLSNLIKDKCYDSFEYLEKNGRIIENENELIIKINPRHKTEKMIAKFHLCLDMNDRNIRKLYSSIMEDQSSFKEDHVYNLHKCMEINEKLQLDCFRNAISDSISNMNYLYDGIITDLNNIIADRL